MSTGLGIFLSSLVLGTIALFGVTKDRWNWRRIGRNTGLGLLAIAVIGAVAFFWDDLPIRFPIPKQTEYAGLRLGMPQDQVKYDKGYPYEVGSEDGKRVIEMTDLVEKGKNVEDYREWRYDMIEHHLILNFDPTKTRLTAIECYTISPLNRCPKIAGITDRNTEQEVIKRFGKPDTARIQSGTKFLNYKNIGVHFMLQEGRVVTLGINDPGYIPQLWAENPR
jgi:hypothetical protein